MTVELCEKKRKIEEGGKEAKLGDEKEKEKDEREGQIGGKVDKF